MLSKPKAVAMGEGAKTCRACGGSGSITYESVPDFVFGATQEAWDVYACSDCRSLFIAEPPPANEIGRYYLEYYTHENDGSPAVEISGIAVRGSFFRKIANSWRNYRYGTKRPSLGRFGVLLCQVFWPIAGWVDSESRHLRRASRNGENLRVLDVGHGDARFMRFANEMGHVASGVEIDEHAMTQAKASGLDVVRGDIKVALETWGEKSFDYITLSHVIEHVHNPREVVGAAYRLLRDDGILWMEWPNPASFGRNFYGARWRDLDPPRHICIPTFEAVLAWAAETGLVLKEKHRRPLTAFEVYPFSSLASGRSRLHGYALASWRSLLGLVRPQEPEWLCVLLRRPASLS